jgi:hypothetical protein
VAGPAFVTACVVPHENLRHSENLLKSGARDITVAALRGQTLVTCGATTVVEPGVKMT